MVKKEALSSDLNFIKEVEELKIKQKLLIESLKRKNSDDQNKLFLEINSKLDFLVNIFNEANKTDENEQKGDEQEQFAPVLERIDELSDTINKKLEEMEAKLGSKAAPAGTKSPEPSNRAAPAPTGPKAPAPATTTSSPSPAPPVEEAPIPDFKSEITGEGDPGQTTKKKKWF